MVKEVNDSASVVTFIDRLEPHLGILVEAIRQVILSTDESIGEHIKWNSPAFFYKGSMKAFDPKHYKRDLLVIHCRKAYALLVFPTGSVIKDDDGILEGSYTDGRRMITIKNLEELKNKKAALMKVIKKWLAQVE